MNLPVYLLLAFLPFTFQGITELEPELGYLVSKSAEEEAKYNKAQKRCNELASGDNLTKTDQEFINTCDNYLMSYWDIFGPGDNWYDAVERVSPTSSSQLPAYKGISYSGANAHDFNYKTAWVEGVEGYGIGENITYSFPAENPRITSVIVVNGYVKSINAWQNNSRVKRLKMYLNEKPYAFLNLADSREEQKFTFEPIGNSDREDLEKLKKKPHWTMKFEIMEVYPGKKYDDTVITEIYFDGIDVY